MLRFTLPFIAIATLCVNGLTLIGDVHNAHDAPKSCPSLNETCQKIAASVSVASKVYAIASKEYIKDISHWASSSTQKAACSLEPGTPEDIGIALRILRETNSPFAVKGGGHATNPGFSSTMGVQISMSRFSDVIYDSAMQTVSVGAGLIWDDVYAALEPHGVNVAGGRVSGIGVAGFTLGGGYSWLTNQHGLAIDTVQSYEVVVPDGTVINVTETSSPDLFFALKGGLNNFGIVTRFTFKAFPQTRVWGGVIYYTADVLDQFNLATANFAINNTDPKAVMITSYSYVISQAQLITSAIIFYDAATPPAGIFDEFLSIPSLQKNISSHSFSSFVKSIPGFVQARVVYDTIPVANYPISLLQLTSNETIYWAKNLSDSVSLISYSVEPFLSTILAHTTSPSAYPVDRTRAYSPFNIYFSWQSSEFDQVVYDAIKTSARTLQAHAIASGLSEEDAVVYPNYAIYDIPLVKLYGTNVPRLQAIKKAIDPENVMGLTGGFKL